MKLNRRIVLDNLKRSICVTSAGAIIVGIGAINLNEKIHRPKLSNETVSEIIETKVLEENDKQANVISFDEVKDEKDYYNHMEYTVGTEDFVFDEVEDYKNYTDRYKSNNEFNTSEIFIVTLTDNLGGINYFIMRKDDGANVSIGDGMLDYYNNTFSEFSDYQVDKWGRVYTSIFNPQYRLVEHGYDIIGKGKENSIIKGEYSRSELWTPSDNQIFIAHLKNNVDVFEGESKINVVHRDYIYKFMPPIDKNNLYKGSINTISLSSLYASKTITYSELCDLYVNLVNQNKLEKAKTL